MPNLRPPRDNIVRAIFPGPEYREVADGMGTLAGHFAVFNEWTRIDSAFEGTFMERLAPGAFARTFANNRDQIKVLFQHGKDPQVGDKPLGPIASLEEDAQGARYEVPLLDTSYNRDLRPGLQAGLYGASFRFRVLKEEVVQHPTRSISNPDGLPERTIREAQVFEFGPVTFPAYAGASASMRSMTDDYIRSLVGDALPDGPDASHAVVGTRSDPPDPPPLTASIATNDPPHGGSSDSGSDMTTSYEAPEDRDSRIKELKEAIAGQAVAFSGELPRDEQDRYDADNAELDELMRAQAAWNDRLARVAQLSGDERHIDKPYVPPTNVAQINKRPAADIYSFERSGGFRSIEERDQEWRDDAMRATEIATFPNPRTDIEATRDKIADLLDNHDSPDKELARRIKATGSPTYRRAFEKILKGRGTISLSPEELRGTALAVGVDGTGGFIVPFAFDPTIIAIGSWSGAVNPYRRVARVVPIVGTDTWNAITATAVTATRTTEAAVTIEQGPTFAQPQYIVKRVQGQITASIEMFQDRNDLASEMAALIQEAKDNEEETSFATGAGAASASIGVGPVNGTSGAYTSITTATSVTLAAADADAVEAALPPRHRFGAQWFLNRLSIRRFQTLETAGGKLFSGNQYQAVGVPELDRAGNTGLRLLGYPVNESPSLPTAQTANIVIGTLLAPNSYVIVERVGMSVNFIPFIFGGAQGNLVTGQQAIYFMWRNHAAPINVDAGRTLRYLT